MPSKSDRTKQLIVEKAAPLFNTKGYAGTTINDIMTVTGLTKGGVYGNFTGKDEIAALAFAYSFRQLQTALILAATPPATAKGKLLAILTFYRNYTANPVIEGGCPVLNAAVDVDDAYPVLKKQVKLAMLELTTGLANLLELGQEGGEFVPTIQPQHEADIMFAQLEGGIMMSKITNDPRILNRIVDRLRAYVENQLSLQ